MAIQPLCFPSINLHIVALHRTLYFIAELPKPSTTTTIVTFFEEPGLDIINGKLCLNYKKLYSRQRPISIRNILESQLASSHKSLHADKNSGNKGFCDIKTIGTYPFFRIRIYLYTPMYCVYLLLLIWLLAST